MQYWHINPETAHVWDAFKATERGTYISGISQAKKSLANNIESLEKEDSEK